MSFGFGLAAFLTPVFIQVLFIAVAMGKLNRATEIKHYYRRVFYVVAGICGVLVLVGASTLLIGPAFMYELSTSSGFVVFKIIMAILLGTLGLWMVGGLDDVIHSNKNAFIILIILSIIFGLSSFSSTGPIIGTILVESADKPMQTPLIMAAFSLGLIIPIFILLFGFGRKIINWAHKPWWTNLEKVIGLLIFINIILIFIL